MLRVVLKGVRGHLLRFVLTTASVVLGVAFVAGSFVLTDSLQVTFDRIFNGASAGTDVLVRGERVGSVDGAGELRTPVPIDLAQRVAEVEGARAAYPELQGSAVLVGRDGTAVRNGGAPSLGFDHRPDSLALPLTSGRGPTSASEVAVEETTLERSGLRVGDSTRLVVGGTVQPVRVVGTVRFAGGSAGATIVVVDRASALRWFAPDGTVQELSVRAQDGVSQEQLRARVAAVLPPGLEAVTAAKAAEERRTAFAQGLTFVNTFLLVFAAVSVFVGMFIIANTFSMLVAQRTRELALLRALGASHGQVQRMVLGEAVVIGTAGGLAGLAAGIGLAWALQALIGTFGLKFTGGLPVHPRTVVWSQAVGVGVTVVCAALPARRAARVAPVAAMRDDVALPERGVRVRGLVGSVVVVVGVLTMLGDVLGLTGNPARIAVGVGAAVAFVGLVIASPLYSRPVIHALTAPLVAASRGLGRRRGAAGSPVASIARDNTLRNPRRTGATAVALVLGLALVSAFSVLAASTKASVDDLVDAEVKADFILLGSNATFPASVAEQAAAVPGVTAVVDSGAVPVRIRGRGAVAAGVSGAGLLQTVALTVRSGDLLALDRGDLALSGSYADRLGVRTGDTVTADVGVLRGRSLRVGAVYEDSQAIAVPALVPRALYKAAVPAAFQNAFAAYVKVGPGVDPRQVRAGLTAVVKPLLVVSVLDKEEFKADQAGQVDTLLAVIYGLLGLAVVIAVLGIINTLALSVFERTREVGLLRAVGYSRSQLRRTITIESVVTALFGAVLGTALGVWLGVSLQRTLVSDGLEVLAVPSRQIVLTFVLAGVAGVLAAVLPAWRAVRLDVLRAVATE